MVKLLLSARRASAFAVSAALTACASAPLFQPSIPLKQARSLQESLILCGEYRMPYPAERPVALRPYRDCVDEAAEEHPPKPEGSFGIFHDELREKYRQLRENEWTPRLGAELGAAVRAALRALWREGSGISDAGHTAGERDAMLRHFPRAARSLGASRWPTARRVVLDPALENLKAGLASLAPGPLESQVERTGEIDALRSEVEYLAGLWKDEQDLARLAPDTPVLASLRERYRGRLETAKRALEDLRGSVAD
jgi:hypothetical protein